MAESSEFSQHYLNAKSWVMACDRADLLEKLQDLHFKSYRLCGMHFEHKVFLNSMNNRLHKKAVPTIFAEMEGSSSRVSTNPVENPVFYTDICPEVYQEGLDETVPQDNANCQSPEFPYIKIKVEDPLGETSSYQIEEITFEDNVCSQTPEDSSLDIKIEDTSIDPFFTSHAFHPEENVDLKPNINDLILPQYNRQTQTEQYLSLDSPRKEQLRKLVEQLENENYHLHQKLEKLGEQGSSVGSARDITLDQYKVLMLKLCASIDSAELINKAQIIEEPKCGTYSSWFRNQYLSLYFSDPNLYKNKLVKSFCLPSVPKLQGFIRDINLVPGINNEVFDMLRRKVVNFQDIDKLCMLCIAEIDIKPNLFYNISKDKIIGFEDMGDGNQEFKPALAATVIMVKGFNSNWKQLISYYLIDSRCPGRKLKEIIFAIISKLKDIKLKMLALVTDVKSNHVQLAKLLDVTPECPFFFHQNESVAFLFDTPCLLQQLKNSFMRYTFVVDNKIVSGEHLKKFYEHDKLYSIRAAPKLTDSHFCPNTVGKVNIKYASQIFSATVAASMNLYIRFGRLQSDARPTEEFIRNINNLFDLLNSSSKLGSTEYRQAYKGNDLQKQFLLEKYALFENLQMLDQEGKNVTKSKCITGWQITINGTIHLWEMLKSHGMKFLLTRRVNQDCLVNAFDSIRLQNRNYIKPTSIQFIRAYRKRFLLDMIHSGIKNCQADYTSILSQIANLPQDQIKEESENITVDSVEVDTEYRTAFILQNHFAKNVCSYLIKKCLSIHECQTCYDYVEQYENLDGKILLCFYKAYTNTDLDSFSNIYLPNENFVLYVASMEFLIQTNFERLANKNMIIQEFVKLFDNLNYKHPCENFPYSYITKLYARLRLFYILKCANTNFKMTKDNNKLIPWKNNYLIHC